MLDVFNNGPYNFMVSLADSVSLSARTAVASSLFGVPFTTIALMSVAAGASLAVLVTEYSTEDEGNAGDNGEYREDTSRTYSEPAPVSRTPEPVEEEPYPDREDEEDYPRPRRGGSRNSARSTRRRY